MPPVIDASNDALVDAHTLERERPQAPGARPRFWRSLASGITAYVTPIPRAPHAPSACPPRPFEAPMDRLVQEYASLSLLALAIL